MRRKLFYYIKKNTFVQYTAHIKKEKREVEHILLWEVNNEKSDTEETF